MNKVKYLRKKASEQQGGDNMESHSHEESLKSGQGPPTTNKFRSRNVGTSDAQRHDLTGQQAQNEPLRPDTNEPIPKALEKYRRGIETDLWPGILVRAYGLSLTGSILVLGSDWGRGSSPCRL